MEKNAITESLEEALSTWMHTVGSDASALLHSVLSSSIFGRFLAFSVKPIGFCTISSRQTIELKTAVHG